MVSLPLSLALLAVLGQAPTDPAPSPSPRSDWAWRWREVYGQRVQILSRIEADGSESWARDWSSPARVAPAELARRQSLSEGSSASDAETARSVRPAFETNGVASDKLAAAGPGIRASDPRTLESARAEAARVRQPDSGGGCPGGRCGPSSGGASFTSSIATTTRELVFLFGTIILGVALAVILGRTSALPKSR